MRGAIHVAIMRKVRPGCEAAFEEAIRSFFAESLQDERSLGAQLLRPLPGGENRAYGILRSFPSERDRDAFYASERFRRWEETVRPLVEPDYARRDLHGLEAFFWEKGSTAPPRWKMAVLTWLGVWPSVYVVSSLLGAPLAGWPRWAAAGVVTAVVVAVLAWAVMPALTRGFRPWLHANASGRNEPH